MTKVTPTLFIATKTQMGAVTDLVILQRQAEGRRQKVIRIMNFSV